MGALSPRYSETAGPGLGLGTCILDVFSVDADAVREKPHFCRNIGPKEQKVPLKVSDDQPEWVYKAFSLQRRWKGGSGAGKEHKEPMVHSPSSGALSRGQETAPQFL